MSGSVSRDQKEGANLALPRPTIQHLCFQCHRVSLKEGGGEEKTACQPIRGPVPGPLPAARPRRGLAARRVEPPARRTRLLAKVSSDRDCPLSVPARSGPGPRGVGDLCGRARVQSAVSSGPGQGRSDPAAPASAPPASWLRGRSGRLRTGAAAPGARARSCRPGWLRRSAGSAAAGAAGSFGGAGEERRISRGAGAPD